jgi:hypothetical protein
MNTHKVLKAFWESIYIFLKSTRWDKLNGVYHCRPNWGENEVPKFSKDEVKLCVLDASNDSTHSIYISLHSARQAEFIASLPYSVTWPLNFDIVNIYIYIFVYINFHIFSKSTPYPQSITPALSALTRLEQD